MNRVLIWDLPTRLFHALLALGFLGAFLIANVAEHGPAFPYHMILGLVLAFAVLLRLVWGLVGSRHARFSTFPVAPRTVLGYLRDAVRGRAARHAGHNPGAASAALAFFALILGLAVTGLLMGQGVEAAEDLHGLLAWAMIVVIVGHLAGLALHTRNHKEPIALSMVDGKKLAGAYDAIPSARPVAALVFVLLVGGWAGALLSGFDPATERITLPVVGATLQLGEGEEHGEHEGREGREGHRDHDDD